MSCFGEILETVCLDGGKTTACGGQTGLGRTTSDDNDDAGHLARQFGGRYAGRQAG